MQTVSKLIRNKTLFRRWSAKQIGPRSTRYLRTKSVRVSFSGLRRTSLSRNQKLSLRLLHPVCAARHCIGCDSWWCAWSSHKLQYHSITTNFSGQKDTKGIERPYFWHIRKACWILFEVSRAAPLNESIGHCQEPHDRARPALKKAMGQSCFVFACQIDLNAI